jgi:hypothetical protein
MKREVIKLIFSFVVLLTNLNAFSHSNAHFVFSVDTRITNKNTSNENSVIIPCNPKLMYNFSIDWDNDGNFDTTGVTSTIQLTFPEKKVQTIRISGLFPSIAFYKTQDRIKFISINQWGNNKWIKLDSAFYRCKNINIRTKGAPDLSKVKSINSMFEKASNFNSNINNWNTSSIENMESMFKDAISFNKPVNLWNVSKVKRMSNMFHGAKSFNRKVNKWDTKSLKITDFMFHRAKKFNQDISSWNLTNIKSMDKMLCHSGMSIQNYDLFIKSCYNQNTQENIILGAKNIKYLKTSKHREYLTKVKKWKINGDQLHTTPQNSIPTSKDTVLYLDKNNSFVLSKDLIPYHDKANNPLMYIKIDSIPEKGVIWIDKNNNNFWDENEKIVNSSIIFKFNNSDSSLVKFHSFNNNKDIELYFSVGSYYAYSKSHKVIIKASNISANKTVQKSKIQIPVPKTTNLNKLKTKTDGRIIINNCLNLSKNLNLHNKRKINKIIHKNIFITPKIEPLISNIILNKNSKNNQLLYQFNLDNPEISSSFKWEMIKGDKNIFKLCEQTGKLTLINKDKINFKLDSYNLKIIACGNYTCTEPFHIKIFTDHDNNFADSDKYRVFPNPSHGYITIETKDKNEQNFDVYIYNMSSNEVYKKKVVGRNNQINTQLDAGKYIMLIRDPKNNVTRKIIVVDD